MASSTSIPRSSVLPDMPSFPAARSRESPFRSGKFSGSVEFCFSVLSCRAFARSFSISTSRFPSHELPQLVISGYPLCPLVRNDFLISNAEVYRPVAFQM